MKVPKSKRKISLLYLAIDFFFIFLCFWSFYFYRYFKGNFWNGIKCLFSLQFNSLPLFSEYFSLFFFFCIIISFSLQNYGLYGTKRGRSLTKEIFYVFKAVAFSGMLSIGLVFIAKFHGVSRLVFFEFLLAIVFFLSIWRALKRWYVESLVASGYNNQNVLIVGAGQVGKFLAQKLSKQRYLGLKFIGFLDDHRKTGEHSSEGKILGKTSELERIVNQKFIDQVFITFPLQGELVNKIISQARKLGVGVKIVPEYFENSTNRISISYIGSIPLLEYYGKPELEAELMVKRFMDIVLSFVGLMILSPLFMAIAILIKLDSPGPIFYISPRIGRKGKIFKFYKFRSMSDGAEKDLDKLLDKNEKDGPIFKMKKDPRTTKIGRFIRKYGIDEFSQLWNVLKGDMSLVGPRPPTPSEVDRYKNWELKRINVIPGMTSPYVIQGRSDLSFEEWVRLDLDYMENWSLWLDLKILLKTVPAVIKGKGAY